jgi:hypothetical protein
MYFIFFTTIFLRAAGEEAVETRGAQRGSGAAAATLAVAAAATAEARSDR